MIAVLIFRAVRCAVRARGSYACFAADGCAPELQPTTSNARLASVASFTVTALIRTPRSSSRDFDDGRDLCVIRLQKKPVRFPKEVQPLRPLGVARFIQRWMILPPSRYMMPCCRSLDRNVLRAIPSRSAAFDTLPSASSASSMCRFSKSASVRLCGINSVIAESRAAIGVGFSKNRATPWRPASSADRNASVDRPQLAEEIETVLSSEHEIENHGVVPGRLQAFERIRARGSFRDGVASGRERAMQCFAKNGIVLDEQKSSRLIAWHGVRSVAVS